MTIPGTILIDALILQILKTFTLYVLKVLDFDDG